MLSDITSKSKEDNTRKSQRLDLSSRFAMEFYLGSVRRWPHPLPCPALLRAACTYLWPRTVYAPDCADTRWRRTGLSAH